MGTDVELLAKKVEEQGLKKRAKQAKQEARRPAREARRARVRLQAGEADHDHFEKGLREVGTRLEKRRDELANAEAAHAAAQAEPRATGVTRPRATKK